MAGTEKEQSSISSLILRKVTSSDIKPRNFYLCYHIMKKWCVLWSSDKGFLYDTECDPIRDMSYLTEVYELPQRDI